MDGGDIDLKKMYTVGMSEFLFAGGDDFNEVVKKGLFK